MNRKWRENRKIFWIECRRLKGELGKTVKGFFTLVEKVEKAERWREHSELLSVKNERSAAIVQRIVEGMTEGKRTSPEGNCTRY